MHVMCLQNMITHFKTPADETQPLPSFKNELLVQKPSFPGLDDVRRSDAII